MLTSPEAFISNTVATDFHFNVSPVANQICALVGSALGVTIGSGSPAKVEIMNDGSLLKSASTMRTGTYVE